MVTIKVGKDLDEFNIHKNLLCDKSPYYKAMFNGQFIEGNKQVAEEKEVSLEAFALFHAWLYSGSVPEDLTPIIGGKCDNDKVLVELYVFGDKTMLRNEFKQGFIRRMLDKHGVTSQTPSSSRKPFSADALKVAVAGLAVDDAVLQLCIHLACLSYLRIESDAILVSYTEVLDLDALKKFTHHLGGATMPYPSLRASKNLCNSIISSRYGP